MNRIVLLIALIFGALFLPIVASAQHDPGCACGRPASELSSFQIEISGADNLAVQSAMAKWNRYADVFRAVAGDGVMGPNGVSEIGFLSASDLGWTYGADFGWSYAVTLLYPESIYPQSSSDYDECPLPAGSICNTFTEADIVLLKDSGRGWESTVYPDFDDLHGPVSVNATAVHELGSALGFRLNQQNLSAMNNYEDFATWYVSVADAALLRQRFPSRVQSVTDVATYPFVYRVMNGSGVTAIVMPSDAPVVRGGHISVSQFTIENVGTTNLTNVVLRFYLSTDANVTEGDTEIGSLTLPALESLGYFDGIDTWYFRVPESVAAGTYYLGARVTYGGGQSDGGTYNNAWVAERRIRVSESNDPTVTITSPVAEPVFTSSATTIALAGTATGTALQWVTWHNLTTGAAGSCSGRESWTAKVPLALGENEIIVQAGNGSGMRHSDSIVVMLDETRPTIIISTPATLSHSTTADSIQLGGTASDAQTSVDSMAWSTDRGESGTMSATSPWSIHVPLLPGANVVTITAADGEGKSGSTRALVYRDMTAPTIALSLPSTDFASARTAVDLTGRASDDVGIASISWTNSLGGGGSIAGAQNWYIPPVPLQVGVNVLTVTATDAAGRTASDSVTVTRRADTTPPVVGMTTPAAASLLPIRTAQIAISGLAIDNEEATGVHWTSSRGYKGWAAWARWSFQAPVPFGVSIFSIRARDVANNISDPVTVTVVRKSRGDFGGDGRSELLWRRQSSGETTLWLMNGRSVTATIPLQSLSSAWTVSGVDDFDGDARSDVLWRNNETGALQLWRMHNGSIQATEAIMSNGTAVMLPATHAIEAVGDFDADTRVDLLVRDTVSNQTRIWFMNGASITANQYVAAPPMQWSVLGVGDFNGDGRSDILWRNSATNEARAWLMNGAAIAGNDYVASPPNIWAVRGVGDFTGDGYADILWRNSQTHQVVVWKMSVTSIAATSQLAVPASMWDIRAVGDFNADSLADMMWRNTSTGENVIWLMLGTAIRETGFITSVADQSWTVVGPR